MEGNEFRKTEVASVAKHKELKEEERGNKPNTARMLTHEKVYIPYG